MKLLLAITAAAVYATIGTIWPVPVLSISAVYLVGCYFFPRLRCWVGFHDYAFRYVEEEKHVISTILECRRCTHTEVIDHYGE